MYVCLYVCLLVCAACAYCHLLPFLSILLSMKEKGTLSLSSVIVRLCAKVWGRDVGGVLGAGMRTVKFLRCGRDRKNSPLNCGAVCKNTLDREKIQFGVGCCDTDTVLKIR